MRHVLIAALMVLTLAAGCSQTSAPRNGAPLPAVTVGVVGAVQPIGTSDLLAGFIRDGRELASPGAVQTFDSSMMKLLREQAGASRNFRFIQPGTGVDPSQPRNAATLTALQHWLTVGRNNGLELLIIPQILTWHERDGSAAGAVSTAEVDINFYLLDVKEGTLLQRSHFAEKQEGLANNLLTAGSFFRRGAKWLTAQELADEAVVKMIKEFGL